VPFNIEMQETTLAC